MEDKVYFAPGDIVQIRQNLPNAPTMVVIKKETTLFKHKDDATNILKGIKCRWFTSTGELQEAVFSTKDLKLISK